MWLQLLLFASLLPFATSKSAAFKRPSTPCEHLEDCNAPNGKCLFGKCVCSGGYTGDKCEEKLNCHRNCLKHGSCVDSECRCWPLDKGYSGDNCEYRVGDCPDDCQPLRHIMGKCLTDKYTGAKRCQCPEYYCGRDCKMRWTEDCPVNRRTKQMCSGKGICCEGLCMCESGLGGPDCSESVLSCPEDFGCDNGGVCEDGKCACAYGWKGHSCNDQAHTSPVPPDILAAMMANQVKCPSDCFSEKGHGTCDYKRGICSCNIGFYGDDCGLGCPGGGVPPCSGHGQCLYSKQVLPNGERGGVGDNQCECEIGWGDEQCTTPILHCPTDYECNPGHGVCLKGKCKCNKWWFGASCDQTRRKVEFEYMCPDQCSGHGVCVMNKTLDYTSLSLEQVKIGLPGVCDCEKGSDGVELWTLENCAREVCPANCYHDQGHGQCNMDLVPDGLGNMVHGPTWGVCECFSPWAAANCSQFSMSCPTDYDCEHGKCVRGKCVCSPGWWGYSCRSSKPPSCSDDAECGSNAACMPAGVGGRWTSCQCNEGYRGDGQTCDEVDGCLENNGECHTLAKCTKTGPGTVSCECPDNYDGDGRRCEPNDPCKEDNGACSDHAFCTMTGPGERTCKCMSPYKGDGINCELDISREQQRQQHRHNIHQQAARAANKLHVLSQGEYLQNLMQHDAPISTNGTSSAATATAPHTPPAVVGPPPTTAHPHLWNSYEKLMAPQLAELQQQQHHINVSQSLQRPDGPVDSKPIVHKPPEVQPETHSQVWNLKPSHTPRRKFLLETDPTALVEHPPTRRNVIAPMPKGNVIGPALKATAHASTHDKH